MKRISFQTYLLSSFIIVGAVPTAFLGITEFLASGKMYQEILARTISWGGLALLLAAVCGAFLTKRVLSPVSRLAAGIAAASRKEFSETVQCSRSMPAEIAALTDRFNEMIERLQVSYAALEEANEQLTKAHKESEQKKRELETIFACMADGVLVTDRNGAILQMNESTKALFGLGTIPSVTFGTCGDVFRLADLDGSPFACKDLPFYRAAVKGESSTNTQMLVSSEHNETRQLSVSSAPLTNELGESEASVTVLRDVTSVVEAQEIRRRNEALEIRNQQIRKASRDKGQFLAKMSHELRTPLNAIIGFSKRMEDSRVGTLNDRQSRYIRNVQTSGQHLLELVNDILDLSKIEAAKLNLVQEHIGIPEMILEAAEIVRPLADEKHIELSHHLPEGLPCVFVDEKRIKQVLLNLLSNAVKFTPEGGRVWVQAKRASDAPEAIEISVHDTGIGIPAEELSNIFAEFHQVDSSLARTQIGTGLGLNLAKKLVELHQGSIDVRSEVGEGSVFSIQLPVNPNPVYALVVEDQEMVSQQFAKELQEKGFEVIIANSGGEGIEKANEIKPDLIFLEMNLSDKTGFEIMKSLKNDPQTSAIPVVIMTAGEAENSEEIKRFITASIRQGDLTYQKVFAHVQRIVKICA